ncbi:MAG TPA: transposase [Bacteriovoracaceae bacterium]|nr:transposase [Bacteriovoracaceae bacterium]
MSVYSNEFKGKMVAKLLSPGGPAFTVLSEETGVHHTSLRQWVKAYGNGWSMTKKSKTTPSKFTPEEKLQIIIETASLKDNALGDYLRKKGLHSSQLEEWKQETLAAMKTSPGRPKKDSEVTELKQKEKRLEKELHRKDRALAEMSARIILLKKSRLIWGDAEEEE